MFNQEGIILKLYPLGGQGLIVVWLTPKMGIVRTAARTARKQGSEFFGQLDLFYACEWVGQAPRRGDLYNLTGLRLMKPHLGLRSDLLRLRLASYMVRMLMASLEEGYEDASWYELLAGGLDYLDEHAASRAIMLHFEKRLAGLHGLEAAHISPYQALLNHAQDLPSGREELFNDLR